MKTTKTSLTPEEVKRIARLARLPLSQEEIERFTPQLSEVLNYFNKLNEVDTSSVKPTYQSISDENRFQEQKLEADTLSTEEVLKNAKEKKDGYVLTEQVIK
ncbi:MAG: Aspartyl/glutamyl-tRNA(Asn/Gln) amidotransferase subunit C [Microgenomates group bacterium GW2011_GWC1_41_8]|nr:MAG: Aspartyl/glutamyl-tRNA(Asn/Gln) amidotransferase subunit C [Candidatus Levybacteria bacterium GW2011_GWA2_40_16]KKS21567.1 MAG: Aspartyl/glutamyl-tRNA(Asn/Gln) amidotransferase subunit C [Candidatus Roizmanbacteria bacterium GW2011_GWC2_41_7]KKS23434.1 MAG: Aspartyl/glutamyl-tRNA(Asn/Gln) amidotransferase subunit C [Microgenomates group bacterium GW2011_GWC1_41_8]OGK48472.1 MAG: hypothetical protein A3A55_01005 [Candidatus Roizmanbacteria bacterium RIFCSPLOWO2_01_FULL_40_14]